MTNVRCSSCIFQDITNERCRRSAVCVLLRDVSLRGEAAQAACAKRGESSLQETRVDVRTKHEGMAIYACIKTAVRTHFYFILVSDNFDFFNEEERLNIYICMYTHAMLIINYKHLKGTINFIIQVYSSLLVIFMK